jgi:MFS transporter, ACS family, tartrate transporter
VFLYLTNTPMEAHWLSSEQRAWLVGAVEETGAAPPPGNRIGVLKVVTSKQVWLLVLVYFGVNFAGYGITFWLPTLIRNLSAVSTISVGFFSAIPYAAALIVMVFVGMHADKAREHKWHIAVPALLAAIALVSAGFSSSVLALVAAISLAVVTVFSVNGPFWALSTTIEPQCGAAAIALINSVGNLGGLFGSYAIGALRNSSSGFRHGIMSLGLAVGFAGCLAILVRAQPPSLRAPSHRHLKSWG